MLSHVVCSKSRVPFSRKRCYGVTGYGVGQWSNFRSSILDGNLVFNILTNDGHFFLCVIQECRNIEQHTSALRSILAFCQRDSTKRSRREGDIESCLCAEAALNIHQTNAIRQAYFETIGVCRIAGTVTCKRDISPVTTLLSGRSSYPFSRSMHIHLTVVGSNTRPGSIRLVLTLPLVTIIQLELHGAHAIVQICVRVRVNRIAVVRELSLGHHVLLPIVCISLAIDIQLNRVRADI